MLTAAQFLDEVRVLSANIDSVGVKAGGMCPFHPVKISANSCVVEPISSTLVAPSSPLTADNEIFTTFLASRIPAIKSAIEECMSKFPAAPADIRMLQQKLNETLAALKSEKKVVDRLSKESSDHKTAWEAATERYLKAEKRVDRIKSSALNNLEKQGRVPTSASTQNEQVNGDSSSVVATDSGAVRDLEDAHKKALIESTKSKEQLERLEEENKKLTAEISTLTTRLTCLSDDDFAKTDLFKASKAQQEDLIKRINHLEGTNIQLREEAKKLQAERMEYRRKVDEETRKSVEEAEQQMGKVDSDLQRIRQERDALQDKLNITKAARPEYRATLEKMEVASKAKDARIAALEEQSARLKVVAKEVEVQTSADLDSLSAADLKAKVSMLQKELEGLQAELPHMEAAYTKYHSLGTKKVNEFKSLEERVTLLNAEKAKADQKFYTAMKDKEAVESKSKYLSAQNAKTSALISAFKETEGKLHEAVRNLEKQIAEHQMVVTDITTQHQSSLQQAQQAETMSKHIMMNVVDLKKKLSEKDDGLAAARKAQHEAETGTEKLQVDLESLKKDVEEWRGKARSNPTEEVNLLRVSFSVQHGVCAAN